MKYFIGILAAWAIALGFVFAFYYLLFWAFIELSR